MDALELALGIGSFGLSLFGSLSGARASRQQEASYNKQAALNRKIGEFNAMIAERLGAARMQATIDETKRTLASQMVEFSNRGVSLEGSPMLVLGETLTMGESKAQEEYFNAQVNKVNALYGAWTASKAAEANAENSRYSAISSMINTAKSVKQGVDLARSMINSSPVNKIAENLGAKSTVVTPVDAYYQFLLR